ncbi:class I SAM-dependent methyltransferase [Candidatus Gracilibacteria bacterium]|nr:class I SAM-dependent methyltransferase [Candidatus Gracilibacteria bacterium]
MGCGTGRDSLYFAEKGFQVDAFDFSQNALNGLQMFSKEKGLDVHTILGSVREYIFIQDHYDVIYACNSLHYFNEKDMRDIVQKLKTSLRKGGYIFIRVKSIHDRDFGKGERIGNNFYKNGEDIKYYFESHFLQELFDDFEILEIRELQDTHNKISGETTMNGFIDIIARKS